MREKRECKVVQDLLPNYIEKLTDKETNLFIEEHLKTCEECKATLESMEKDLKVDTEKVNTKGINIFKKYNRELKLFRNLLLLVIVVYVIIFGYKFAVLTDIYNKTSKQLESPQKIIELENFYSKSVNLHEGYLTILESYVKNGKELTTITMFDSKNAKEPGIITRYHDKDETLIIYELSKTVTISEEASILNDIHYITESPKSIVERIFLALSSNIHTVTLENKKCYLLKFR